MLVTFILSQQNNIPRIKYIIERLCDELGEIHRDQFGKYYTTFPSAETILEHQACIYNDIGAGFRDKYLIGTAIRWILNRDRILSTNWNYKSILSELKEFYGVGDKIANCIALFGFGFTEAFPMDVWIKRIISNYYVEGEFDKNKYGEYAGIVQQYMYYYARLLEDKLHVQIWLAGAKMRLIAS